MWISSKIAGTAREIRHIQRPQTLMQPYFVGGTSKTQFSVRIEVIMPYWPLQSVSFCLQQGANGLDKVAVDFRRFKAAARKEAS